jgi:hypothetical protein
MGGIPPISDSGVPIGPLEEAGTCYSHALGVCHKEVPFTAMPTVKWDRIMYDGNILGGIYFPATEEASRLSCSAGDSGDTYTSGYNP